MGEHCLLLWLDLLLQINHTITASHVSHLFFCAGKTNDRRIKKGQVGFQMFRRVALWVKTHKHQLYLLALTLTELLPTGHRMEQGGWANIRAMGETKKHQRQLAVQAGRVKRLAVLVDHAEVAPHASVDRQLWGRLRTGHQQQRQY